MARFQFVEWLFLWLLDGKHIEFEWDQGNQTKNALKHRVSRSEVEEVFEIGMALPIGIQTRPTVSEERLAVIGPTAQNRNLTIVFVIRNGKVRPISARPSNKKERNVYEEVLCQTAERV